MNPWWFHGQTTKGYIKESLNLYNILVTQILYYQFKIRIQNYTFITGPFTFRSISFSHLKSEHIDHPFPVSGGCDIFPHCVPADVWKLHAPFCISKSTCHFPQTSASSVTRQGQRGLCKVTMTFLASRATEASMSLSTP